LKPATEADARTLLRRLSLDLTGLPPTLDEVDQFINAWDGAGAKRGAALQKVVDRLLASRNTANAGAATGSMSRAGRNRKAMKAIICDCTPGATATGGSIV
jgi:Protein of unknown function (DUF1549)